MINQTDRHSIFSMRSLPQAGSATAIVVGLLVLIGWISDVPSLKSILPHLVAMKANTALAFTLAGVSLWILQREQPSQSTRRIGQACAVVVALVGVLTLSEYGFGWDLGLDQLLFEEPSGAFETSHPGRMALATALNFLLIGCALLLLNTNSGITPAQYMVLSAMVVAFITLIGYIYGVKSFYSLTVYTSMAVHTALTFLVLCFGLLSTHPTSRLMSIFTSENAGGVMAQRLLPFAILTPVILGWLRVTGQDAGLYDMGFGTAIFTVALIIIFVFLIGHIARSLSESDEQRRQAEKELAQFTQTLEQRVIDRTMQLEASQMKASKLFEEAKQERAHAGEAEAWLRASEAHTRRIVEMALDGFIEMNAAGTITDWNVQAEQMFGWPQREAIGRLLSATIIPAQHREAHERELRHFLATGEGPVLNKRIEITACHRDGREFPVELAVSPALVQEGAHTFSAFVRDISERKRMEERSDMQYRLTLVLAEAETLIDAIPNILRVVCNFSHWDLGSMWLVNETEHPAVLGCAESWHQPSIELTEFLRVTKQTVFKCGLGLPGRVWASDKPVWILDVTQDANFPRALVAAQANLHSAFAFPIRTGDTVLGVMEFFSHKLRPSDDDLLKDFIIIGGQIGQFIQRKRAEAKVHAHAKALEQKNRALDEALTEAQAATQAKASFLATMSHEIRTPLNGVIGMTSLLLETAMTPQQRDYIATAQQSGEALLTIINDILDFSKIEAGRLALETIDFDLLTAIEETLDLFAEPTQRKGLELGCLLHAEVPMALRGDPGRVRQVLVNLISNAIKFTHQGEVMLHVTMDEETADRARIAFAVTDTGIGIASEAQPLLFQPFSQVDSSITRKFGGTGLGLVICQQLVELMEGQIGIESVPGQGTTVRFTVWLTKQPAEAQAAPLPRGSLEGRRVCIVDDNATNRRILEQYASQWGLQSASVSDGYQALALLKDAARLGAPFEVAILDMQMPGMDGLALGHAITADPLLAATRLVLLTSIGLRGEAEKARQAGIAAYLTKPVHYSQLYDCLSTIVTRSAQSATDPREGGAASRPTHSLVTRHTLKEAATAARARILVAEDNITNQKVMVGLLENLGYRADVVANGLEAVEAVFRGSYTLVLMDCQMPEMDGLKATAMIRQREVEQARRRLPIIAVTANALQGDREKCLKAGMDDYLAKPVGLKHLKAMLARWMPGQSTSEEQQAPGSSEQPELGHDCVDAAVLADLRQLDISCGLLSALITQFLNDAPSCLTALQDAHQQGDAAALARVAHKLTGASGTLGVPRMRQLCSELQALGKAQNLTEAGALLAQLVDEFELVRQRLMAEHATPAHDTLPGDA